MGWRSEVLVGERWSRDGIVWPDEDSARYAGADLLSRWLVPTDYRAVEVKDEEPNRPTWAKWIAKRGLPPKRVQV